MSNQSEILRTGNSVERHMPFAPRQRAETVRLGAGFLRKLRPYDPERDASMIGLQAVPRSQADGLQHVHVQVPAAAAEQTALRIANAQQTQLDASRAAARLAASALPPQFNAGGEWN